MRNWSVVYFNRDESIVRKYIATMKQICPNMGIEIFAPTCIPLPSDRTENYVNAVRRGLPNDVSILSVNYNI